MNILQVSTSSQTLSFIPRAFHTSVNLHLRRESTNVTLVRSLDSSTNGAFLDVKAIYVLVEDEHYSFDVVASVVLTAFRKRVTDDSGTYENNECLNGVLDDLELIYRGKIFVTSQDLDKYTINDGVYVEDTTKNNEYVTL